MNMNERLSQLAEKEVSRGEFLGILGLAVVSILGFGSLIKLLTGTSLEHDHPVLDGYSSSVYGGTAGRKTDGSSL